MIPVLIVEDEYLVRMGLRTTIEWERFGFKVVGDASSAEKGLELYQQHHPFLILTDIRMAPMDGLEMIARIRAQDDTVHFFIISAYSEFEYAQKAIRQGVDLYIDKARFSQEDIHQALDKVRADYQRRQLPSSPPPNLHTARLPKLNELDGRLFREQPLQWCRAQGLSATGGMVGALRYNRSLSPVQNLPQLADILAGMLQQASLPHVLFQHQGFVVAILDTQDAAAAANACRRATNTLEKYTDSVVCMGISPFGPNSPLPQALYNACCHCNNAVFNYHSTAESPPCQEPILTKDSLRAACQNIQLMVHSGQPEKATQQIHQLLQQAGHYRALERVVFLLANLLENLNPSLSASTLLLEALQLDSIEKIQNFFSAQLENLPHTPPPKQAGYIDEILLYISEHLNADLSLKTIAARFHLSPNYLGKLFRRQTGVHLNSYVVSCRMNKACTLIRTTGEPIGKIGAMVGIENPHYFSKLFKDTTGQSPHQYRSSLLNEPPIHPEPGGLSQP